MFTYVDVIEYGWQNDSSASHEARYGTALNTVN